MKKTLLVISKYRAVTVKLMVAAATEPEDLSLFKSFMQMISESGYSNLDCKYVFG